MKICFIGHRRIDAIRIRNKLKFEIEREIKLGYKSFCMGTHGDFDKLALSVCRELRNTYKDVEIEVVLTSFNKLKKILVYDDEYGKEFERPFSDVKTTFFEIEQEYFKRQITLSNRKMIDECDTLICYVDEKRSNSGAKLALKYAKMKGLKIINLY